MINHDIINPLIFHWFYTHMYIIIYIYIYVEQAKAKESWPLAAADGHFPTPWDCHPEKRRPRFGEVRGTVVPGPKGALGF